MKNDRSLVLFETLYHTAEEIEFDPEWANVTGYFDNIVKSDLIHRSRFIDDNNRKVVVIPTHGEIVVMNERFTNGDDGVIVVCIYDR